MCLDGEKNDRVAFQARADYQNHAIGWLHRGYSSLGGGKVVRFPRIWMVYGECRLKRDLSAGHYVYFWADGIHVQARLEDDAQCLLVIIGATPEGKVRDP